MLTYSKPGAKMVISVPIEVGPSLLFKQVGRYFANTKGSYGYERYHLKELFSASILWDTEAFPRLTLRKLRTQVTKDLTIEKLINCSSEK